MSSAIYLTGVPGAGKSTVGAAVADLSGGSVIHFSYSAYLGRRLQVTHHRLRAESGRVVTTADVDAVDRELLQLIVEGPTSTVVLIDSHAVTFETYGLRVVPFQRAVLEDLRPRAIVSLWAPASVIAERIAHRPEGRRNVDVSSVDHAQQLQEVIAGSYAVRLGIPLHVVDASPSRDSVVEVVSEIVGRYLRP